MQTKFKKNLIIVLATLFLFAFFVLSALPITSANADIASAIINSDRYTNVMDDLQKDENFNTDDYPAVKDDFSIRVIQIAESSANELFVYTYQPAHDTRDLVATSINISTGTGDELSYWNYDLALLSTNGVFDKYLVKDFTVSTDEERTYDISNIYRAWNKDIDNPSLNEDKITFVGYKVGKCFYAKTDENSNVLYGATETEVVTITDKYVGMVDYSSGLVFDFLLGAGTGSTDCHFVAFSTDHEIDRLLTADVFFRARSVREIVSNLVGGGGSISYGKIVEHRKTLSYDEKVVVDNSGEHWFKSTKTWSRIKTGKAFSDSCNLNDDIAVYVEAQDFVLCFLETSSSHKNSGIRRTTTWTEVSDVSILRLEFETDGIVYNLGVVDDMRTGDGLPDDKDHDCILDDLLIALIITIVVVWFIDKIMPWFFPFIGKCIGACFKAVWYVVSFKWLYDLITHKKRKQPQQVVIVKQTTSGKRKRKGKKKPPTK